MFKSEFLFFFLAIVLIFNKGYQKNSTNFETVSPIVSSTAKDSVICADARFDEYFPLLKNKKIALVANQTAVINGKHLLDILSDNKIKVVKIFAPEHGFRGNVDRGKDFKEEIDEKTKIPILPLFGATKKMNPTDLEDIDIVVFDIQDAGSRFFTYISTMHYVMEACAKAKKKLIILDRPNPLGDYTDGPVKQKDCESFVGVDPIPIVHGLTVGELAQMINGEHWLKDNLQCDLTIIKVLNYNHSVIWSPPVKSSPNLPNLLSIRLYPSLCFFEATEVSIGRGTEFPFQVIGFPDSVFGKFSFIPKSIEGMESKPIQENKKCFGIDLRNQKTDIKFTLKYFIDFRKKFTDKEMISNPKWFNLLAGNTKLIKQIQSGTSETEIRKSWEKELSTYKKMRKKYLLYDDFEK